MEFFRLDVEDRMTSGRRLSLRLLDDKGQRGRFVKQSEFSFRMFAVARIEEDPPFEKIAMKIGDERADVAGGCPRLLDPIDISLDSIAPEVGVSFVDAEDVSLGWNLNILVGEEKLADARIERKAMDAVAGAVDHHRR